MGSQHQREWAAATGLCPTKVESRTCSAENGSSFTHHSSVCVGGVVSLFIMCGYNGCERGRCVNNMASSHDYKNFLADSSSFPAACRLVM